MTNHHEGFIAWEAYEMSRSRIPKDRHPRLNQAEKAVRGGVLCCRSSATCGCCGRRLRVRCEGRNSTPGYYCCSSKIADNRSRCCMRVGGVRIDEAVAQAFLQAAAGAGLKAALRAETDIIASHDAAISQRRLQAERVRHGAELAELRDRTVEDRLVARSLEVQWEQRLTELADAEADWARREREHLIRLTDRQRGRIRIWGADPSQVWNAPYASHPVLVHRLAPLLRASFRPPVTGRLCVSLAPHPRRAE